MADETDRYRRIKEQILKKKYFAKIQIIQLLITLFYFPARISSVLGKKVCVYIYIYIPGSTAFSNTLIKYSLRVTNLNFNTKI